MNSSELLVRFVTVALRIHIGITARKQHAVQRIHHARDVVRARNQRNVDGQSAGGFNGLAVVARQIEAIRFQLDAHRNADAWPLLIHESSPTSDFVWLAHNSANASLLHNLPTLAAGLLNCSFRLPTFLPVFA